MRSSPLRVHPDPLRCPEESGEGSADALPQPGPNVWKKGEEGVEDGRARGRSVSTDQSSGSRRSAAGQLVRRILTWSSGMGFFQWEVPWSERRVRLQDPERRVLSTRTTVLFSVAFIGLLGVSSNIAAIPFSFAPYNHPQATVVSGLINTLGSAMGSILTAPIFAMYDLEVVGKLFRLWVPWYALLTIVVLVVENYGGLDLVSSTMIKQAIHTFFEPVPYVAFLVYEDASLRKAIRFYLTWLPALAGLFFFFSVVVFDLRFLSNVPELSWSRGFVFQGAKRLALWACSTKTIPNLPNDEAYLYIWVMTLIVASFGQAMFAMQSKDAFSLAVILISDWVTFACRVWVFADVDLDADTWGGYFRRQFMWGRPVPPDYVDRRSYRTFDLFMEGVTLTGALFNLLIMGAVCCSWGPDWTVPTRFLFPLRWTSWIYLLIMFVQDALQDAIMKYLILTDDGNKGHDKVSAVFPGWIATRRARKRFGLLCLSVAFMPGVLLEFGWLHPT